VEKVWNRSEQIARRGYSIVIHGKPNHEEQGPFFACFGFRPSVVVNDIKETEALARYITGDTTRRRLLYRIQRPSTPKALILRATCNALAFVNQTTQLGHLIHRPSPNTSKP